MGLLDNTTQQQYYNGKNHGDYQFTSLNDIITQFIIAYVGENKIIPKAKRTDVAFHAQRALQELSFDTLKSVKAQEIIVPATLQMTLPQDYINYTKLSWVDSAGIKHLLYPTSKTSNPLNPVQDSDGDFGIKAVATYTDGKKTLALDNRYDNITIGMLVDGVGIASGAKVTEHHIATSGTNAGNTVITIDTPIDTTPGPSVLSNMSIHNVEVRFYNSGNKSLINTPTNETLAQEAELTTGRSNIDFATAQTGIHVGDLVYHVNIPAGAYVTAVASQSGASIGTRIWISEASTATTAANQEVLFVSPNQQSDTWSSYKSTTPSENNNNDYEDDVYWPLDGERYGLDPQHAQANGSFYVDVISGKIHFSSNISGKTVILDYISDSLGTDDEMQVHKFAEEAMYKHIAYAILSTSSLPIHQQLAPRFKKEKFATTRQAKLRLSNIKLEELTQILRGKSKQIKH